MGHPRTRRTFRRSGTPEKGHRRSVRFVGAGSTLRRSGTPEGVDSTPIRLEGDPDRRVGAPAADLITPVAVSAGDGSAPEESAPLGDRPHRWRRRLLIGCGSGAVALGGLAAWVRLGPLPDRVLHPAASQLTTFADRNGLPLDAAAARALQVGKASGKASGTGSRTVGKSATRGPSLAKRADRLAAATLAAEDQRFRSHLGVDPIALGRAAIADLKAGRIAQGGSTISQQLVKLRLGRRGDSLTGKLQESVYALRLEHRLSKDAILSDYLSEAPYGGRVIGADAAAQIYFAKPVSQLTWGEAAFLAAIPQRPTAFNPRTDVHAAGTRQRWILGRLRGAGTITVAQERVAKAESLHFADRVDDAIAPHFTAMLAADVAVTAKPGTVRTTLDAALQKDVAGIARHHRELLRKSGAANVAVVVLDNRTGAVRAWEGSGDYFDWTHGGMINGPLQKRQTGSTIKPFVYGMAFDDGLSPGDLIDDAPFDRTYNGNGFHPQNYDKKYRGIITLRTALASSVNVAAVKLLDDREPEALVAMLDRAGVVLDYPASRYGLSMALGTAEIDLLDLTRAYAAFARGGRALSATFTEPAAPQRSGARVVTPATAFLIGDVLNDNAARASAFGRTSALRFPFPVAAKTGTSQDFHDNWVVGYTTDFTVGVWVGNFDRLPLRGATGVTGAGPIFHAVMLATHRRLTPNAGLEPGATLLASVPGDLVAVDACARAKSASSCEPGRTEYEWAGSTHPATHPVAHPAPSPTATKPARGSAGAALGLRLLEPVRKGRYLIDPGVPLDAQKLPLRASGGSPPYTFAVDDQQIASRLWPVRGGSHTACVRDASGGSACSRFTVGGAGGGDGVG